MKKNISISILNVENVVEFLKKIKVYEENKLCDSYDIHMHFDVMDNKFVPNTGVDLEYVKIAKEMGFFADVHLMVEHPLKDRYIFNAIDYGCDNITIHYEIENFENILNELNEIKKQLKEKENRNLSIGISIKPNTMVEKLKKYENLFDMLLVMSVEPGFGGQKFIEDTITKIKKAKELFSDKIIQVDGGVNFDVLPKVIELGVNSFVIGSYITKSNNLTATLNSINLQYEFLKLPMDANFEFEKKLLQIVDGGYGEHDLYLGVRVPVIRKFVSKWWKVLDLDDLYCFVTSKYHDFRRFAAITLTNFSKNYYLKKDIVSLGKIVSFLDKNISYMNNWDLTDLVAPDVLGRYIYLLDEDKRYKVISRYIKKEELWEKRIGIVSLLFLARKNQYDFCISVLKEVMYDDRHLISKAVGWVLRELYKKNRAKVTEFLVSNNKDKKLPSFVVSYACEHMSKEEKQMVKGMI